MQYNKADCRLQNRGSSGGTLLDEGVYCVVLYASIPPQGKIISQYETRREELHSVVLYHVICLLLTLPGM